MMLVVSTCRQASRARSIFLLTTLGALLVGCATAPAPGPGPEPVAADLGFPPPYAGNGVPATTPEQREAITTGWRALASGDSGAAKRYAAAAGGPVGRLLELQTDLAAGEPPVAELHSLAADEPGYAAAWLTLSVAAEAAGDEGGAIDAAERAAVLWPTREHRRRARELYEQWVETRIDEASALLERGETERAVPLLEAALEVDSGRADASLALAGALVELGRLDEAAVVVADLEESPDVLALSGDIAAQRGEWEDALALYQQLPRSYPGRQERLDEATLRWRLANLPPYVASAMSSAALTRAELAVLAVALVPQVRSAAAVDVPLLSDIVDLPERREIAAAVAAGLIGADPLERRFNPGRIARTRTVEAALSRLAAIVGATAPTFCDEGPAPCLELPDPIPGELVTELVLRLLEEVETQ